MTVVASNYARKENDLPQTVRDALTYNPETGNLYWRVDRALKKVGDLAGHIGTNGYITVTVDYVAYYAHHLAIGFSRGCLPAKGTHVDHIDGDKTNNQLDNLRVVSVSINGHNRTRLNANNASGARGVFEAKPGRFIAFITVDRKRHHLGTFDSLPQAKQARDAAQFKLVGTRV